MHREMLESKAAADRLAAMRERYKILLDTSTTKALGSSEARELNRLEYGLELSAALEKRRQEAKELRSFMDELMDEKELLEEAERELNEMVPTINQLEADLIAQLVPKPEDDESGAALVEIRAGAGGDEATAFARELLEMYEKYAALQRWKFELLDASKSEYGGVKTAFALVRGDASYATLQYESGVHRVQRVPGNDTKIHTSTASVVVFPQQEDDDKKQPPLNPADLKIETMRSGGAGGQHVNTTDSAVRITHIPTGIQCHIQDERSQHKNKDKALKVLTARVHGLKAEQERQERNEQRASLQGTGDRSERVRTYNFQHDRVVDHRSHFTANSVARTLDGILLHDILHSLRLQAQDLRFHAFINSSNNGIK